MRFIRPRRRPGGPSRAIVTHEVVRRHRVEVEVWPARVEVFYRDERAANPINTQVRFEATLLNTSRGGVRWEVRDLNGNPGAGDIDQSGLYRSPDKGARPNGLTDIVVATSRQEPLRKAFAWVTLVGLGPAALPTPRLWITPGWASVYYRQDQQPSAPQQRNELIDPSNTVQMFRANITGTAAAQVVWSVDGLPAADPEPTSLFLYKAPNSGPQKEVVITARLQAQPSVTGSAKVLLTNYVWPEVKNVGEL